MSLRTSTFTYYLHHYISVQSVFCLYQSRTAQRKCSENAQKMEHGESTERLCIFFVVPVSRLCTKYHRKQVQNFRTSLSTECLIRLVDQQCSVLFLRVFLALIERKSSVPENTVKTLRWCPPPPPHHQSTGNAKSFGAVRPVELGADFNSDRVLLTA